jgi:hypothetical protein
MSSDLKQERRAGDTDVRPQAHGPPEPPIGTRGVIFGTVLLGVLLLGFALWANEAGKRAGAEAPRVPQIVMLSPSEGDEIDGPVVMVFQTPVVLLRGPAGWEADGLHIHASLDGMELMPGADAIERVDGDTYRWTLGTLPAGTRELRLFWADRRHRELTAGASETVRVRAR